MMEGFGVHTFRLINDRRKIHLCEISLEAVAGRAFSSMG